LLPRNQSEKDGVEGFHVADHTHLKACVNSVPLIKKCFPLLLFLLTTSSAFRKDCSLLGSNTLGSWQWFRSLVGSTLTGGLFVWVLRRQASLLVVDKKTLAKLALDIPPDFGIFRASHE